MQIGRLEHQILFQKPTSQNKSGQISTVWVDDGTVWATVTSQRGDEAFEAARTNASETVRVLMRYRPDIDTTFRFVWEGQTYYVTLVDRSKRRQGELWLTAQLTGAK